MQSMGEQRKLPKERKLSSSRKERKQEKEQRQGTRQRRCFFIQRHIEDKSEPRLPITIQKVFQVHYHTQVFLHKRFQKRQGKREKKWKA